MSQNLPVAPAAKVGKSLIGRFSERYNIDADKLLPILKATAFKLPPAKYGEEPQVVSNEQMAALLVVADQYKLNPFTKEIYAFPDKSKGIVPIVSVDGWARIINEHPMMDGLEFRESESRVKMDDDAKECPEWIECLIFRKDRSRSVVMREYLDECYRPAFVGKGKNGDYKAPGPWQSHTKRFLRHKSLIQCARVAFGFAGIYDDDEGKDAMSWGNGAPIDVTPEPDSFDTSIFDVAITQQGIPADDPHLAAFIEQIAQQNRSGIDKVKAEASADIENFVAGFKAWLAKKAAPEKQPQPQPQPTEKTTAKAAKTASKEQTPTMPAEVECPNNGSVVRTAVECAKCKDRIGCPKLPDEPQPEAVQE